MTDFYISDTHFGHAGIIRFCGRPWGSVEEMDRDMMALWNSRVGPDDHVWHLGDFSYKGAVPTRRYLEGLNGRKHLVIGNHDHRGVLKMPDIMDWFESVGYAASVTVADGKRAFLCHYPLADPPRHVWCLYGHVHNGRGWDGFGLVRGQGMSLNCCADVNGYMPVTFEELVRNNVRWRNGA